MVETDGRTHRFVSAGVIRPPKGVSMAQRLACIHEGLTDAMRQYRPEAVAIEEVFHAANVKTALQLAHVRGVALLVAAQAGVSVGEYSPLAVKTSVVGYGRAEKHQVQHMVASLLAMAEALASQDASDALAVAICHATSAMAAEKFAARA